ncbi:neutral zinc metallopeptidase [Streptomyces fructofermentans]|uniref:neutral zinc metallopeptidase n=1 Tax=Streptomyces fructofermentans TaxID=152141 RepID=UPI0037896FD4
MRGEWCAGSGARTQFDDDAELDTSPDAAAVVRDDRIREHFRGRGMPESWSHGSAARRRQWFERGHRAGAMARYDTFR